VTATHKASEVRLGKNVVNVKGKPKPNRSPNPNANTDPTLT